MPDLQLLPLGQTIVPFRAGPEGFSFDVYDVVTQRFSSQHYVIGSTGSRRSPSSFGTRGRRSWT